MYIHYYVKFVFICLSGRQYNDKGKLEEWWDPLTVNSYYNMISNRGIKVFLCTF
jgi:hypothetical protein